MTDTRIRPSASERGSVKHAATKRNPAPLILLGVALVLAIYYVVLGVSGMLAGSNAVNVAGGEEMTSNDHVTLEMRVQDIDLANLTMQASMIPRASGIYAGDKPGEMREGLRIVVTSGGTATQVLAIPGEAIVDATTLTVPLGRGDSSYPFDKPVSTMSITVETDEGSKPIPFDLDLTSSARPWLLNATLDATESTSEGLHTLNVEGTRDFLSIALVLFYVLAILITTLIACVTIGIALLNKTLEFSNVIWLSATMISFPALRSSMPAAPPIGTAFDFLVFFPCMALVAVLLVWTGGYLLWRESASLRRLRLETESQQEKTGELAVLEPV